MSDTSFVPVVIIGAGMAGLTTALALQQHGVPFVLAETAAAPVNDPRTTAFNTRSVEFLSKLGLWQQLTAQPITNIHIAETARGATCDFLASDAPTGAPMGHIVWNRDYLAAITARLEAAGITALRTGAAVALQADSTAASVTFANGQTLQAALVIAADGKASKTRQLAGIHTRRQFYPHSAVTGVVQHTDAHQGWAFELFTPDGILALLPLPGGTESCFVWTVPHARADALAHCDTALFTALLQQTAGDALGTLSADSRRAVFRLNAFRAERLIASRLALVADAAHSIHPLAGQGFNLGLRDITALVDAIQQQHHCGLLPGDATSLRAYEQQRLADIMTLYGATDGLHHLFASRLPLLRQARPLGLHLTGKLPGLRRRFVRYAAGYGVTSQSV